MKTLMLVVIVVGMSGCASSFKDQILDVSDAMRIVCSDIGAFVEVQVVQAGDRSSIKSNCTYEVK